jgi:hypothetical protein
MSKEQAKKNGKIASLGTERNIRQCYRNFRRWCDLNGIPPGYRANISTLKNYLEERTEWVMQKT